MSASPVPPAPPTPIVVRSAAPPAGSIIVKGAGWRVTLPVAVLVAVASALGARLLSSEQRLRDQAEHIRELERACERKTK